MKMGPLKIVMGALCAALGLTLGCKDSGKVSTERAAHHVATLAETVKVDVEEIRRGLPEGAKALVPLFRPHRPAAVQGAPAGSGSAAALPSAAPPAASVVASPNPSASARPAASSAVAEAGAPREITPDAATAREALLRARDKVQDLRVAKATFFALTDPNAIVLRNDQEQDLMATKPLLPFYPELRRALTGKYVEGRGSMPEAAGVRGRADGQWVAAQPVMVEGRVRALYVAGWSWSAYAYRLETSIRGIVRSELPQHATEPLLYVFIIVDKEVFAAPVSPDVDLRAVKELDPLSQVKDEAVWARPLTITSRTYGLAVKRTPVLGPGVAIVVLRSEV
jgi:hypothetical protein